MTTLCTGVPGSFSAWTRLRKFRILPHDYNLIATIWGTDHGKTKENESEIAARMIGVPTEADRQYYNDEVAVWDAVNGAAGQTLQQAFRVLENKDYGSGKGKVRGPLVVRHVQSDFQYMGGFVHGILEFPEAKSRSKLVYAVCSETCRQMNLDQIKEAYAQDIKYLLGACELMSCVVVDVSNPKSIRTDVFTLMPQDVSKNTQNSILLTQKYYEQFLYWRYTTDDKEKRADSLRRCASFMVDAMEVEKTDQTLHDTEELFLADVETLDPASWVDDSDVGAFDLDDFDRQFAAATAAAEQKQERKQPQPNSSPRATAKAPPQSGAPVRAMAPAAAAQPKPKPKPKPAAPATTQPRPAAPVPSRAAAPLSASSSSHVTNRLVGSPASASASASASALSRPSVASATASASSMAKVVLKPPAAKAPTHAVKLPMAKPPSTKPPTANRAAAPATRPAALVDAMDTS